jgi:DNA repair exonuclease SbcCD ATPase subunit
MGDSAETQQVIDKLLMSHVMFKNIVLLNTYTQPFLNMSVGDQRMIIEQLLGITLLTEKADKLRDQMKATKDLILKEDMRITAVQNANKRLQEQIESIKRRQKLWHSKHNEDIGNLSVAISELSNINIADEIQLHQNWTLYNNYLQQSSTLKNQLDRKKSDLQKEQKQVEKIKKEIVSLHNNTCYACGQSVENHQDQIIAKEQSLESLQSIITALKADIITINMQILNLKSLDEPTKTFYDNVNDAVEHKSNLENLKNQLQNKQQDVDPYQEQIEEMSSKGLEEITFDTMNGLKRIQDHEDFLLKLLTNKDSFIRKRIIEQNLTFLNARLSYYLYKMGLPHTVVFQNDLSVTITEYGRDLDWGNLSRGEASRTILSLSLSFRDVWESLYQPINLLSLDEMLDGGIDTAGVENAMGLLKHMTRDKKRSVWLVSHREELSSRVNNTVTVTKENGFSQFYQE